MFDNEIEKEALRRKALTICCVNLTEEALRSVGWGRSFDRVSWAALAEGMPTDVLAEVFEEQMDIVTGLRRRLQEYRS